MRAIIEPSRPVDMTSIIHSKINKTPVNKESIEAMTRETDKKVIGTFVNIECPGQPAKVCGRYYKGMEYFSKVFEDGERCTIPMSVSRWINERSAYDQHSYLQDERGNPIKTGKKQPRYKFMVEQIG
jgi:hypothetical protein